MIIIKERDVKTYVEMWHTSKCLLEKGIEQQEGNFHQFMASIVFTAFTFEAYLNHVGPKVFECWLDLERLGPREKLNIIAEKLNLEIDYGIRPWQVMTQIFAFRNRIAHGKTEIVKRQETVSYSEQSDNKLGTMAPTKWEEYCTKENAIRAREDVESMVKAIHIAGCFEDDYPFVHGVQIHCGSFKK